MLSAIAGTGATNHYNSGGTIMCENAFKAFYAASIAIVISLLPVSIDSALSQQPIYTESQLAEVLAIGEQRDAFVADYAAGNVEAIAGAYHDEATFAGTLQPFWLDGKPAIQDLWQRYFAAWPTRQLIFRQPTLRFYGEAGDTAVETGYLEMFMAQPEQAPVITNIRYSITRTKTGKGWQIVNMNVARLPGQ